MPLFLQVRVAPMSLAPRRTIILEKQRVRVSKKDSHFSYHETKPGDMSNGVRGSTPGKGY